MADVQGTLKLNIDDLLRGNPGDFAFYVDSETKRVGGMNFRCPCGCDIIAGVNFPNWSWNESREKPTVTPSIQILNGCRWHGYLTDGIFGSV